MPLQIDPNNSKNIEFLEYIVNKIVEAKREGQFKIADITVQQSTKVFPIFEKTQPSDNVDTAVYEAMIDANKEIDQEAHAIYAYLYQMFQGEPGLGPVQRTNENPLTFEIRAVCKDEPKIFRIAEELKRKKPKPTNTKKEDNDTEFLVEPKVYYNSKTGKGFVDGRLFTFRSKSKEFKVFAALYKKINNPIEREK